MTISMGMIVRLTSRPRTPEMPSEVALYDPYLYLLDPECQVYEQDDDSSSGSDYGSEIEVAAGFPYDGIWTLVATSYYGSESSQGEGGVELAVARQ